MIFDQIFIVILYFLGYPSISVPGGIKITCI